MRKGQLFKREKAGGACTQQLYSIQQRSLDTQLLYPVQDPTAFISLLNLMYSDVTQEIIHTRMVIFQNVRQFLCKRKGPLYGTHMETNPIKGGTVLRASKFSKS